jgi:DNA repair protein RecN (Recombination protein N)
MLRHLSLRDFVIVDRLELDFAPGFTALTGETGAGKSILIDALGLVVGARGDASVVREGFERSEIAAEFDCTDLPELRAKLVELDLDDGASLLLRRVIDRAGRSRAYVNGRPATVLQLRELGEALLDIHGQHEHQSLLRGEAQRDLLDGFAAATQCRGQVGEAFVAYRSARALREAAERDAAALAAERERLTWCVSELEPLAEEAPRWRELATEQRRLANAAALIDGMRAAAEQLADGEVNAQGLLAHAQSRLAPIAEFDPRLEEVIEYLDAAAIQVDEANRALGRLASATELEPRRLAECEARLDAILTAAKKYQVAAEALPEHLSHVRRRLEELDQARDPRALAAREAAAEAAWRGAAERLSTARSAAALRLGTEMSAAMASLGMVGGRFAVALNPLAEPSRFGAEQVEFVVAANAGTSLRGLARVASGGELSRICLALQVIRSDSAAVRTLLFDEVDAGVGGAVAESVGRSMRRLGERRQVLCVTHLPQVAAQAHQHWSVDKVTAGAGVASRVRCLGAAERVEEIARMLGGQTISETTRRHAGEMLQAADH